MSENDLKDSFIDPQGVILADKNLKVLKIPRALETREVLDAQKNDNFFEKSAIRLTSVKYLHSRNTRILGS